MLNLLRNPGPLIVFDSGRLAIPAQAPRLWLEPVESKASGDSAPEWGVAPFQRGPARDQFAVGRDPGIPADTSTGHRSHHRRSRASATRPAHRGFSPGLAASTLASMTKKPGRRISLPVDSAPLCSVPSFRVSSFPVSNLPVAIPPFPILQVLFSPVPQALDRQKASLGARILPLPKQLDLEMTLIKMTLKKIRTEDLTLEELVWYRFRRWPNASPS